MVKYCPVCYTELKNYDKNNEVFCEKCRTNIISVKPIILICGICKRKFTSVLDYKEHVC